MQLRFSLNSPVWQIEWFRNHWKSYWDFKFKNRAAINATFDMPALEIREDFSLFLKSLGYDAYLDASQIVCVECSHEDYVVAYLSVNSVD